MIKDAFYTKRNMGHILNLSDFSMQNMAKGKLHTFIITEDCELYLTGLKMTACSTMSLSHWRRHSHLCEDFQRNQDEDRQARKGLQ